MALLLMSESPMRLGRRFVRFWILLFVACGTGCAGCGNCFDIGPVGGCTFGDIGCDGGWCTGEAYDSSYPKADGGFQGAIRTGLVAPGGLATDGVEVFYVDEGMLVQIDQDGSSPLVLATGVDASGGLRTDGVYVYWSGGWSGGGDGGADDAGADAGLDAGDAGDDAGASAIASIPGIYAVLVNGGDVQPITSTPTLPTFDTDDFSAYVRTPLDDAGTSAIGILSLAGDGGFSPLATLSGNTGNLHAFARRSVDLVALDQNDIVSVLLDGGGKSILEADAGALALLQANDAAVSVGNAAPFFTVHVVGQAAQAQGLATLGPYASSGNDVYAVDQRNGTIYRYDAANITTPPVTVATAGSPIAFLAADSTFVYWVTPGPNGAIYSAAVR